MAEDSSLRSSDRRVILSLTSKQTLLKHFAQKGELVPSASKTGRGAHHIYRTLNQPKATNHSSTCNFVTCLTTLHRIPRTPRRIAAIGRGSARTYWGEEGSKAPILSTSCPLRRAIPCPFVCYTHFRVIKLCLLPSSPRVSTSEKRVPNVVLFAFHRLCGI